MSFTASARRLRPADARNAWLMLVLQLPVARSNQRVKTWRRLQQLGAVAIKSAVYVLPNSAHGLEDFEWVRTEVVSVGGEASVFAATAVEGMSDDEIIEQFRQARAADYTALLKEVRGLQRRHRRESRAADDLVRAIRQLRERVTRVQAIDFFTAPGRGDLERALGELEQRVQRAVAAPSVRARTPIDPAEYRSRVWVTRPRPGVDRFASAWLISRFIDRDATFVFATAPGDRVDAVPFDMFGGGFGHEGEECTFEALARAFHIDEPQVRRIGEIVHDLDLNDERYRATQAPGIRVLVEGLRASFDNDAGLLQQGMTLFEALYRGLQPLPPAPRRIKSREPAVRPRSR